jgi:polyisoprenoid-binding protein YceI
MGLPIMKEQHFMSTGTETTAAATTWKIDPAHTNAEFSVRHLMISSVKGRFAEVSGSVVKDAAAPAKSQVEITINTASLDTREPQRDGHLRSADFFDVEKFPTITFRSTRIDGSLDGDFKLVGNLTIKDVTREVVLEVTPEGAVTDPWGGQRVGYSATTKIKRSEFGLTWNLVLEAGGVTVGEDVKISLDVELLKQA